MKANGHPEPLHKAKLKSRRPSGRDFYYWGNKRA